MSASSREESRAKIKKTIERIAPEIDQTRVLSDEEMAALKRQFEEREAAKLEAQQMTREQLRARVKTAAQQVERGAAPSKILDPEKLKRKLES